jgi:hypothetical protein
MGSNFLRRAVCKPAVTEIRNGRTILNCLRTTHKWVPVTTAWRVLRLRMEQRPPIWRVAANILNNQSRTADNEWSSIFGVGRGANNSSPSRRNFVTKYSQTKTRTWTDILLRLKVYLQEVGYDGMEWIELAQDSDRLLVNAASIKCGEFLD